MSKFASEVLAHRARELRLRLGLTQEQVAASSHLDLGTVTRVESGNANPTLTTLIKLARALECNTGDLLRVESVI